MDAEQVGRAGAAGTGGLDHGALDRDGWCTVDLLDDERLAVLRARFDRLAIPADVNMHVTTVDSPEAVASAEDYAIKEIIAAPIERLAPGYVAFLAAFIVKGRAGGTVDIHQDWTYHDEQATRSLLFWCPLVDVDDQAGCLHVIDGSHRWETGIRGDGDIPQLIDDTQDLAWSAAHPVPLRAGEAIAYDPALLHGSAPNGGRIRPVIAVASGPSGAPLVHFSCDAQGTVSGFTVDERWFNRSFGQPPVGYEPRSAWGPVTVPLDPATLTTLLASR